MNKTISLKHSVILKQVNDETLFAINCESEDDQYFKFEGPAKFFLECFHQGLMPDQILQLSIERYPKASKSQIENDITEFFRSIETFNFIQF